MKWPQTFTFIRHGQSAFNASKLDKKKNVKYQKFKKLFQKEYGTAQSFNWPSAELKELAEEVWRETKLPYSDYATPLTKEGVLQAKETGKKLKDLVVLPDAVYVSPYLRTRQTLLAMRISWPKLKSVKIIFEERIREQEHGLVTLYNDWRIHHVFNPLQALLYKSEGDYSYRYLNGESKADVRDRVRSFMTTVIRENAGQNVLVISHHLTLISLRSNLERWPQERFIEVDTNQKPINCGVTIYRGDPKQGKDGRLILDKYNQKLY